MKLTLSNLLKMLKLTIYRLFSNFLLIENFATVSNDLVGFYCPTIKE